MTTIVRATLATLGCLIAVSAAGASGVASTDPSFAPGPTLPVGLTPSADAVGDFDGNGSADLAVANAGYKNNLRILLNELGFRRQSVPVEQVSHSPAFRQFIHSPQRGS